MINSYTSTPHARGSTFLTITTGEEWTVYPACAGIHREKPLQRESPGCLPRMRGDPPFSCLGCLAHSMSTPHARGSTLLRTACPGKTQVYPACAGIHLRHGQEVAAGGCLPRMRGDPPARFFGLRIFL